MCTIGSWFHPLADWVGLSNPVSTSPATFDIPAELSSLPSHGYTIDVRDARQRMLQRQRELHPDKFGSGGEVIVELARDLSGRVNEAYSVLADPLKRADYIVSSLCPLFPIPFHRLHFKDFSEQLRVCC